MDHFDIIDHRGKTTHGKRKISQRPLQEGGGGGAFIMPKRKVCMG